MICASFARPVGLFDNVFNRFVTWLTGGEYCHSEFIFTWDMETATKFFETIEDRWIREILYCRTIGEKISTSNFPQQWEMPICLSIGTEYLFHRQFYSETL